MKAVARGKINWALKVVGKTSDNYHLLDMATQSVSIADTLTFTLHENELRITLEGMDQTTNIEDNLVYRAAQSLKNIFSITKGIHIHLQKQIPIGAGLGGGSADGAATLVALNHLWQLGLSTDKLEEIGLSLGADVPFCIKGGLQHVQGIGEKLTSYTPSVVYHLLVIKPVQNLDTKKVFSAFEYDPDNPSNQVGASPGLLLIKALQERNLQALAQRMKNDLQPTSSLLCPSIQTACDDLLKAGALQGVMTGSGSAVIGLFSTKEAALQGQRHLLPRWSQCYYTHTCNKGIDFYC